MTAAIPAPGGSRSWALKATVEMRHAAHALSGAGLLHSCCWTLRQVGGVVLAMNYMMKTVIFQLREWERKTHPHDLNISTWTQNRAPANMIQKRGSSVETIFYKVSFH